MEKSCRLCANTEQPLQSIADHRLLTAEHAATITLHQLIEQYLAIRVYPSTHEPLICANCLKHVEEWHEFRESCQRHNRLYQKQQTAFDEAVNTETPCELYFPEHGTKSEEVFDGDVMQLQSETESSNHVPNESPCPETNPKQNDLVNSVKQRTRQEGRKQLVTNKKRGRSKRGKSSKLDQPAKKQRPLPKICTICGVARTDMSAHMRYHNNVRPYQCPHCPKIFLNSSNLKNHINLHTREKMYKCDLCDKEFPSTTGRSKHRETHTEERTHLCSVCGKSFKYQASLARHKLIHFEEPKERCTVCDMVFLTKTRLNKHLLVHMDVKPFTCDVCGRAFNRKDNLKTHQKTHITGRRNEKKQEIDQEIVKTEQIDTEEIA